MLAEDAAEAGSVASTEVICVATAQTDRVAPLKSAPRITIHVRVYVDAIRRRDGRGGRVHDA